MTYSINKKPKPIPIELRQKETSRKGVGGVWMEILLLYAGIVSYIFCNTTALKTGIPAVAVIFITLISFGLMILLAWYKRVFFSVLGAVAGISLIAYPVTFPMYKALGYSLSVCYNYIIYLLGSQEGFSGYLDRMSMDLTDLLDNPLILQRHFYTAVILLSLIVSIFFALGLFRRIPILISFTAAMIGLVPLFMYGIVPHYVAFSVFLSALIGCYGQNVVQMIERGHERRLKRLAEGTGAEKEKKPKEKKKTLTTAQRLAFAAGHGSFGVIVAVMMLGITLGTASLIYSRPIVQMDQVRSYLDRAATATMNFFFRTKYEKELNVAGYLEEGEHLSLLAPSYRHLKVAGVATNTGTPVYLRFRTTVDLVEDGWTVMDDAYLKEYDAAISSGFNENTQFYNYLKLTAPDGDPRKAGLDGVDSEEQGYMNDNVVIHPYYKVSNILAMPKGAVENDPVGEYYDLMRQGDTIITYEDAPRDRAYSYQVVSPVLTSKVFLTNFDATQQAYLALAKEHARENEYLRAEREYSRYVQETYTTIPTDLAYDVRPLANELTANYDTQLKKMQAIERYFRTEFTYSLDRVRLKRDDGKPASAADYINYFLFQNEKKTGYCTLFASSMVSMVRSMGIPARVVSGYYVQPKMNDVDDYGVVLYDNDYHSWVEVYFDGMGWVSFEPTPSYGMMRNYYLLELIDENKEAEIQPNVNIIFVEDGEGSDYTWFIDELPDPVTDPEEEQQKQETQKKDPVTETIHSVIPFWRSWMTAVLYILLVLGIMVGILAGGLVVHRNTLGRVRRLAPDQAVRRGYELMLRLMRLWGIGLFEGELLEQFARRADNLQVSKIPLSEVLPIFQKALYSQLPIGEEEREKVVEYIEALNKAAFRKASPFKALWYRWTLWVKPRYKKTIWRFE